MWEKVWVKFTVRCFCVTEIDVLLNIKKYILVVILKLFVEF